jgi:lycopene cyclase domain-containing protein
MKGLYLLLDGATILCPLLLSFDKKVAYMKQWKYVLLAATIVSIPFLIWDVVFTAQGIWGFNPDYLVGWHVFNLPVEEVLFFLLVPFSCMFIYACVKAYFGSMRMYHLNRINAVIYFLLLCYTGFVAWGTLPNSGTYSRAVIVSSGLTFILLVLFRWQTRFLPLAFVVSLAPFLLVNGILTGAATNEPIVWYNSAERLPFSILTIPVEDVLYSFTLIGLNVLVYELISSGSRRYH